MSKQQFLDKAGLIQYDGLIQHKIDEHIGDAEKHISSSDKSKLNTAYSHSQAKHAPADAEKNTITTIKKNGETLTPDGSQSVNIIVPTTAVDIGADPSGSADKALTSAKSYTDQKVAALVDSAPTTLDTLGEVAAAIKEHQDVTDALDAAIGNKANKTDLSSHTGNLSNPHKVTKEQIGLGNVPNVSTNDQTPTYSDVTTLATLVSGEKLSVALSKIKIAITNLINHIANKNNPHTVTKAQLGLGNVDNTSDVNKPISTAVQKALDGKASSGHTHTIDSSFSTASTNPVQNKVVTEKVNSLQSQLDNLITIEDIDEICGELVSPVMVLNSAKLGNAVLL